AAARSRRAMGNVTLASEDARGVWVFESMERVWRDALYALRSLRREPGFTLPAVLTLALGVAPATTALSVTDFALWRALPLPAASQLVVVSMCSPGVHCTYDYLSGVDLLEWQRQARAFESLGAAGRYSRGVLGGATAESVTVTPVTSAYFATLGWPI